MGWEVNASNLEASYLGRRGAEERVQGEAWRGECWRPSRPCLLPGSLPEGLWSPGNAQGSPQCSFLPLSCLCFSSLPAPHLPALTFGPRPPTPTPQMRKRQVAVVLNAGWMAGQEAWALCESPFPQLKCKNNSSLGGVSDPIRGLLQNALETILAKGLPTVVLIMNVDEKPKIQRSKVTDSPKVRQQATGSAGPGPGPDSAQLPGVPCGQRCLWVCTFRDS